MLEISLLHNLCAIFFFMFSTIMCESFSSVEYFINDSFTPYLNNSVLNSKFFLCFHVSQLHYSFKTKGQLFQFFRRKVIVNWEIRTSQKTGKYKWLEINWSGKNSERSWPLVNMYAQFLNSALKRVHPEQDNL